MLRLCEAENGTKIAELLQARASGHQQILEDGRVPAKEAKDWKIEGKKMRITHKKKRSWNLAREKIAGERRHAKGRR